MIESIEMHNQEKIINCQKCGDKGFVLYFKKIDDIDYEFVAHCTCAKGDTYTYDGRTIKDRRSVYYVPSIVEVFGGDGSNPFADECAEISIGEAKGKYSDFVRGVANGS